MAHQLIPPIIAMNMVIMMNFVVPVAQGKHSNLSDEFFRELEKKVEFTVIS